jgi:hypothetical protein
MIEPMTQEEKQEYIAIQNMTMEQLQEKDGSEAGRTYARLLCLRKKIHRLSSAEAFALEGARSWAEFNKATGGK